MLIIFSKEYGTVFELIMASEFFFHYFLLRHQCLALIPSELLLVVLSVVWHVVMKCDKL